MAEPAAPDGRVDADVLATFRTMTPSERAIALHAGSMLVAKVHSRIVRRWAEVAADQMARDATVWVRSAAVH